MSEIEAGDGWRLLGPDEVIKKGDEVCPLFSFIWSEVPEQFIGKENQGSQIRRRIPAKPEALDIWNAFEVSVGSGVAATFVIRQMGASQDEWDVVVGDLNDARQLADWLTRYADWREAQYLNAK